MNLSSQIKGLRNAKGLSQEELAEHIYVSRQTISNWETERSYPDVQSLLLLSALFGVSLDDLVKGDIEMMKQTVDANKMNVWSVVMLVSMVIAGLILLPFYELFGPLGLAVPAALIVVGLVASIILERLKKKNNVKTYSEILAFMEGKTLDSEAVEQERKGHGIRNAVIAMFFMAALVLLGDFLYKVFLG